MNTRWLVLPAGLLMALACGRDVDLDPDAAEGDGDAGARGSDAAEPSCAVLGEEECHGRYKGEGDPQAGLGCYALYGFRWEIGRDFLGCIDAFDYDCPAAMGWARPPDRSECVLTTGLCAPYGWTVEVAGLDGPDPTCPPP